MPPLEDQVPYAGIDNAFKIEELSASAPEEAALEEIPHTLLPNVSVHEAHLAPVDANVEPNQLYEDIFVNEFTTATAYEEGRSMAIDRDLASAEHYEEVNGVRARSKQPLDREKLTELWKKQERLELQSRQMALQRFEADFGNALKRDARVAGSRKLIKSWMPDIVAAIQAEQDAVMSGQKARQRSVYGPFLIMLPAEELADIALHVTLNSTLLPNRHGEENNTAGTGPPVTTVALAIGRKVNEQVILQQLHKKVTAFKQHRKGDPKQPFLATQTDADWTKFTAEEATKCSKAERLLQRICKAGVSKYFNSQRHRLVSASKLLLGNSQWEGRHHVLLGSKLLEFVILSAKVENPRSKKAEGAFVHEKVAMRRNSKKRHGVVLLSPIAVEHLKDVRELAANLTPDYNPMVVEPRPWSGPHQGGYLTLRASIMRNRHSRRMAARVAEAASAGQLSLVYDALTALGNTPWVINREVFTVMEKVWNQGGGIAGVPQLREHIKPPPLKNPGFRLVADNGMLLCTGLPPTRSEKVRHRREVVAVAKKNRELASLRATFQHRLRIAQQFRGEDAIYYPHNIDFRGRAYPIHPHLNHLGDDVCRGLLKFAEACPLGKEGLDWLYVQVANHWGQGVDKRTFEERKKFAQDHLGHILAAASTPLEGRRWWMEAEKPWQMLATCVEIRGALVSGNPETYESQLPVHMDGSCNGLQHYAALGKDEAGGRAVNLLPEDVPQDVYKGVADIVARRVASDALEGHKDARLIAGQVDRKLVKQTVMTSVYGVTFVGARDQIANRLRERGWQNPTEVFRVSKYVAKLTLESIGELFNSARDIMRWLGECAEVISATNREVSWESPVGVPVMQPYQQLRTKAVVTSLQACSMTLPDTDPDSKVARKRQRTAFPPNYIHCLDSSHMMMTALACREVGLSFAGVHDSYWTHAGTVKEMNRILRVCFVNLHEEGLLEDLLRQFKERFPEVADEFPRIPKRGSMDVQQVHKSKYFFS